MKKRVCSMLLAIVLVLSAVSLPTMAAASSSFSDVTDTATARNVEVLRLMGVVEGDGNGTFRPSGTLTRAEFCKMLVVLMGEADEILRYRTITIFPDVRASHWSAGYVNYAVREAKLLAGMPNGNFEPDRAISYGEAVTILMRALGYTNADAGAVWPDGYINLAAAAGLNDGISLAGSSTITRAQAAKLFVNLLLTDTKAGGSYASKNYTLSKLTTLISISGTKLRTTDGSYDTAKAMTSTALNGLSGYVLLNKDGKAVTFVTNVSAGNALSNAAVIVSADKSAAGFSTLAGRDDYAIYKNGAAAAVSDLRKNDVASYDAATNTIQVCDTRVTVYYENCAPSTTEPVTITVLDGTVLEVLPTAQSSLAQFKPGKTMTLLLTADGKVAAAVENSYSTRSNAFGIVDTSGKVQMLCGCELIALSNKIEVDEDVYGSVVRISQSQKETVVLSKQSANVNGDLSVSERQLGGKKIADNVLFVDDGKLIGLHEFSSDTIKASQIAYARSNWRGEIDLIVFGDNYGTTYFGRAFLDRQEKTGSFGGNNYTYEERYLTVTYGDENGQTLSKGPYRTIYSGGDTYVAATLKGERFTSVTALTKLTNVPQSAWLATSAVNYGGKTYTVPKDVSCYNLNSGYWMTLEDALAYASSMNLYVYDGVVRVVEVKA